jgi:hypothetical protein
LTLEELAGAWQFSHPSHAGRQVLPAQATIEGDLLVIRVPGFGRSGVTLELRYDENRLGGTYRLGDLASSKIFLDVHDDGRRMTATPQGFANRERWLFVRE